MEFYKEIAFQRAARRMWATMLKERFGAKNPRSMMIRQMSGAHMGYINATLQRPLNNLTRAVIGGMADGMSGGIPFGAMPPWDEALGLGHSLEAQQLGHDATRIMIYEAKLGEVLDPWAGSYFMESITNEIENAAKEEFDKIEEMGGFVAAIDNGYVRQAIARSAYEKQKRIEDLEDFIIGVNCFAGPNELNVMTERSVSDVYSAELLATAGQRKCESLALLKKERNDKDVSRTLKDLEAAAGNEKENLMPYIIECVKVYATLQEICDVMRDVFGEYKTGNI
jgi:methylmalonyl-CoA mutase N-terminal domain/subunit